MGKRAEQNKKRKRQAGSNGHAIKSIPITTTNGASAVNGHQHNDDGPLISQDDLDTTLLTLETLAEDSDELARREVKDVKRAVYALQRVMADGSTLGKFSHLRFPNLTCFESSPYAELIAGTSLSSRISAALQDYRFTDALILLFEMYTRKLPPKLGSLQRWVRECDATVSASGETRDTEAMKCLDLILRIANPNLIASSSSSSGSTSNGVMSGNVTSSSSESLIRRKPTWVAREGIEGEIPVWEKMQMGKLFG
jgi:hypothetical protein